MMSSAAHIQLDARIDAVRQYDHPMSPSKERLITFRVPPELAEAMEAYQERYGTPLSVQCRRAIEAWLSNEGFFGPKADRLRASTRKRS